MNYLGMNTFCVALVVLALSISHAYCQEKKPAGKGINPETVAAYEKLGAIYGDMGIAASLVFLDGRENAENGTPGFRFEVFSKSKLPEVAVPFGLDLARSDVTDANLKELARLKNLSTLKLHFSKVTVNGGFRA